MKSDNVSLTREQAKQRLSNGEAVKRRGWIAHKLVQKGNQIVSVIESTPNIEQPFEFSNRVTNDNDWEVIDKLNSTSDGVER